MTVTEGVGGGKHRLYSGQNTSTQEGGKWVQGPWESSSRRKKSGKNITALMIAQRRARVIYILVAANLTDSVRLRAQGLHYTKMYWHW